MPAFLDPLFRHPRLTVSKESKQPFRALFELASKQQSDDLIARLRKEPNIVNRAKLLYSANAIDYRHTKPVKSGNQIVTQFDNCDENKWAFLDAMFGEKEGPHLDEFRGRVVDHAGIAIDDHYPVVDWVRAYAAAGLPKLQAKATRDVIREWALNRRWNDIVERMNRMIPDWDGQPRMRRKLIELFECKETKLNEDFGEYFWLSLFGRIMKPGIHAPMVLSLFGPQKAGKSFFAKRIVRLVTGNEDAKAVQLDLSGDTNNFLRNITGHSVIASIGEMTGFTRADLNKVKSFITEDADQMHYKFEGTFEQPRGWIVMLDGNSYTGLQRDDTGNRRFYPMFCGQTQDVDGQPAWRADFSCGHIIASTQFETDFWQIMAEASVWFASNKRKGYDETVDELSKKIAEFNATERAADRGTVHDPDVDTFIFDALLGSPKRLYTERKGDFRQGVLIDKADLILAFKRASQINNPNMKHIETKVISLGGEYGSYAGNRRGYFFGEYSSVADMIAALKGDEGLEEKVAGAKREEPF